MAERSIANVVRRFAAESPDSIAIKFGNRSMSWRGLDERSTRAAAGLQAAGVSSQQRVAFLAKNCLEYFEVSFGAAKLNAVVVAINWRLTPDEIAYTIDDAGAQVLIVGPDFFDTVDALQDRLAGLKQVVAIGEDTRWPNYESWLGAPTARDPLSPVQDQDICSQLYTSGTTGLPKGVLTTNTNQALAASRGSRHHRLRKSSACRLQMPNVRRFRGGASPQSLRQGAQEGPASALLDGQNAAHQLGSTHP